MMTTLSPDPETFGRLLLFYSMSWMDRGRSWDRWTQDQRNASDRDVVRQRDSLVWLFGAACSRGVPTTTPDSQVGIATDDHATLESDAGAPDQTPPDATEQDAFDRRVAQAGTDAALRELEGTPAPDAGLDRLLEEYRRLSGWPTRGALERARIGIDDHIATVARKAYDAGKEAGCRETARAVAQVLMGGAP